MAACTFFWSPGLSGDDETEAKRSARGSNNQPRCRYVLCRTPGQFDAYVHSELKILKQEYPKSNYAVVLAYMPGKKTEYDDYSDTMFPEGIESVHPHYAISWRNN